MNDTEKSQYMRRLQDGMMAMTPEQVAAYQVTHNGSMANNVTPDDSYAQNARNMWPEIVGEIVGASNTLSSEKLSLFQKLKRLF